MSILYIALLSEIPFTSILKLIVYCCNIFTRALIRLLPRNSVDSFPTVEKLDGIHFLRQE